MDTMESTHQPAAEKLVELFGQFTLTSMNSHSRKFMREKETRFRNGIKLDPDIAQVIQLMPDEELMQIGKELLPLTEDMTPEQAALLLCREITQQVRVQANLLRIMEEDECQ